MRVFLDTNVFLYAFLDQGAAKKRIAVDLIVRSIRENSGFISLQVVKEFCNVMMKHSTKSVEELLRATELFARFNMVDGSIQLVRNAIAHKQRYGIQFYDALMISSAEASGCNVIFTEDLNDGQLYAGVKAINPFSRPETTS